MNSPLAMNRMINLISPRESRAQRWLQLAISVWIGLLVAHCAKTWLNPRRSVYPIFSQASRNWWNERSVYRDPNAKDGYYYAPVCAVLTIPFAVLPDRLGGMLWSAVSLAAMCWALHRWHHAILKPRFPQVQEGVFLTLAAAVAIQGAWSGQSNSLIIACLLLAFVAVREDRLWAAAFLLALPIQMKIWPVVGAGFLIFRRPRLIPRLIGASLLLALLPLATKSPEYVLHQYQDWVGNVMHLIFEDGRHAGYRDGWTLWERFWPPVHKGAYSLMQAASGLLLAGGLFWHARKCRDDVQYLHWALTLWLCWQMVLGPGSERFTYGIIAPVAAFAVARSFSSGRGRGLALIGWLFAGLLGTGEAERAFMKFFPAAPILLPCSILLLAAWFVAYEVFNNSDAGVTGDASAAAPNSPGALSRAA